MLQRQIQDKLIQMAGKFPVLAITGPRQSGKTTLCKKLFKNYDYVSLENPDSKEFALSDPKGFLNQYKKNVIIDEVQNVPQLFSYIQSIVDESGKTGQYILTGSQNFLLLEKISQTLAGRVYIYHLLPFSYSELKERFPQNLPNVIFKGGYPRIYDKDIHPSDFFPSYIQTYLERDVRNLLNIRNIQKFSTFLKLCAGRIGQIFNSSSIANELDIDHKTITSWLSLLEASFIIYRLQPWHTNFNKRTIKSPKIFFYDTGLACHLLNIQNEKEIDLHFAKGSLFENFIITEHLKNRWNKGLAFSSYFWRDRSGNEIDLLIEKGNSLKIIEIKSAQTIKTSFFKSLNRFEKLATTFSIEKGLIYGGSEHQKRTTINIYSWRDLTDL